MTMRAFLPIITLLLLSSFDCFSQEKRMTTLEYIDSFKQSAIEEMKESKVPASITLAQGILESSSGNSRLARNGNNHFGIKCKKTWTGSIIYEDDDALHECFRAYSSALESYRDHSNFLKRNKRYAFLFQLDIYDYKGWAHGLRKAGYATNKKYGYMLVTLIEKYELHKFDHFDIHDKKDTVQIVQNEPELKKVSESKGMNLYKKKQSIPFEKIAFTVTPKKKINSNFPLQNELVYFKLHTKAKSEAKTFHKVKKGESLFSIAMLYDLNPMYLQEVNNLPSDYIQEGQIIKLTGEVEVNSENTQLENVEADDLGAAETNEEKYIEHIVKKGETLFSISSIYNVPVSNISTSNNLTDNTIQEGQKLKLEL